MSKITKQQIEEWKKTHGDIFKLSIEEFEGFFKRPSRKSVGYASVAGKTNPIKFNEVLAKECWLGGDDVILTRDDLFLSIGAQLAELIGAKEAELVKL